MIEQGHELEPDAHYCRSKFALLSTPALTGSMTGNSRRGVLIGVIAAIPRLTYCTATTILITCIAFACLQRDTAHQLLQSDDDLCKSFARH